MTLHPSGTAGEYAKALGDGAPEATGGQALMLLPSAVVSDMKPDLELNDMNRNLPTSKNVDVTRRLSEGETLGDVVTSLSAGLNHALSGMTPDDITLEVDAHHENGKSSMRVRMRAYNRDTRR